MKECRCNRNKKGHGSEDKINTLLHKYDIKPEVIFGGKLNGVNCRRLMKYYIDIINGIKDLFIKMNKSIVSDEDIWLVTNKYNNLLNEMD